MDLKNIVKFNKLYAQMSPEDLALADALRNASEADRALLIESLQPEQSKKPERNQQARCTHVYGSGLVCNAASRNNVHHNSTHLDFHQFTTEKQKKSKHAQSLAGAIAGRVKADLTSDGDIPDFGESVLCGTCGHPASYEDHFKPSPNYHKFDSGKSPAQGAAVQSSANGAAQSTTASTVTSTDDASVAAGAD